MRRIRFSLRTLLAAMTLLAVYLAWRMHEPEEGAISDIREAGGRVYYGYQQPWMGSTKFISVGMLPGYQYYSQHDVTCTGSPTQPELTLAEILFGKSKEHRANAVALPIDRFTPQMERTLLSLTELKYVIIEMPAMMASVESPDVKRLAELEAKFGNRIWPTVNLGM